MFYIYCLKSTWNSNREVKDIYGIERGEIYME